MYNYQKLDQTKLEFINVCSVEDLSEGGRLFIDIDDLQIVILNIRGQFYAIADLCSHDDGPVGEGILEGYEIICPRHGARFDVRNGQVLALPAFVDIPSYPVRIIDSQVEVGLPLED
jgi:3-phenylpropionate/trans-cinnamate dioxygenase ferredoxin subunit